MFIMDQVAVILKSQRLVHEDLVKSEWQVLTVFIDFLP